MTPLQDVSDLPLIRNLLRPAIEYTIALIKPDAFRRGVVGQIITRIEMEGFRIVVGRILPPRWNVDEFYGAQHQGKPYFEDLTLFMRNGKTMALILWHESGDAIGKWRAAMGAWNQDKERDALTIRGALMVPGCKGMENLVHGSDSTSSFFHELGVLRNELYA